MKQRFNYHAVLIRVLCRTLAVEKQMPSLNELKKVETPILLSLERALIRFLEETPYETAEYAIGFLDALGESLSGKFSEQNYPSILDFYRSVKNGGSGLSRKRLFLKTYLIEFAFLQFLSVVSKVPYRKLYAISLA